ncbi:MAG: histidine phosphatase family protein [Aquificae bacterium]|nr:histidine phosphatase family protein [Aquificota bacterium]
MKRIILVRHGESEYNAYKRIQGHLDTDLTPEGVVQARLLGEYLQRFNIQKIITSDLRRAYRTAQIVGDVLGLDIQITPLLREMAFGQWEGKTYEEIFKNNYQDFQNWLINPVKYPLPEQESIADFTERLSTVWQEVLNYPEDSILIVAHGGSIQGLICLACGFGMENLWAFKHTNTGVSLIQTDGKTSQLIFLNQTPHLNSFLKKENPIM